MTGIITSRTSIADALHVLDHAKVHAHELAAGDEVFLFRASPDIDRCENDSGYTLHVITESTHSPDCGGLLPAPGEKYRSDSAWHRGFCWTVRTDRGEHYTCSPYNTGAYKVGHTR